MTAPCVAPMAPQLTLPLPAAPSLDSLEAVEAWLLAKPRFEIVGVARKANSCVIHAYLREQGVPVIGVTRFNFTVPNDAGSWDSRHFDFYVHRFITEVDAYGEGYAVTAEEALICVTRARASAEAALAKGWGF